MFLPSILASLVCSFSPFPSVVYLRADPDGIGAGWVVDTLWNATTGVVRQRGRLADGYESSGDAAKAAEELKKLERLQAVPK